MKKLLALFLVSFIALGLTACSTEEVPDREVKTYIDWNFNALGENDEIPNTASEGVGFHVERISDGESWVASKNPAEWGAMYFGTPDENSQEIYLKDFAIETVMFLPENNEGLENDGGVTIFVGAAGRYDVAVQIAGDESVVNVWHAGNTVNGPMATTDDPNKGSLVDELVLNPGQEYTLTVLGRYEGMTDVGDEYFTLYVFIDDELVLEQSGLAYWTGGFGIRGWQSAIQYKYVKVTDFPLLAPDGNDYY